MFFIVKIALIDISVYSIINKISGVTEKSKMKILFLCTANVQRSKTAEEIFRRVDLSNQYKSAGLSAKYTQKMGSTLCTEAMLKWADSIYVFEEAHIERIKEYTGEQYLSKITNLHIEDEYQFFQRELVLMLLDRFSLREHMCSNRIINKIIN